MFQVTWQESNKPIGLATMKLEPIGCHWPHTFCAKRTKYPIWGVYHFWITGGRLVIFQFTSDKLGRWICRMKIHNNLARLPTFIDRVYYSLFCDMKINSVNFAEFTTIYLGSTTFVTLGVLQICGSPNLWSHWFSGPMQNSCLGRRNNIWIWQNDAKMCETVSWLAMFVFFILFLLSKFDPDPTKTSDFVSTGWIQCARVPDFEVRENDQG